MCNYGHTEPIGDHDAGFDDRFDDHYDYNGYNHNGNDEKDYDVMERK